MCGIIGIYSHKPVVGELYDGMIHLQHRGTDAAGMVTYSDHFHTKKGQGYVREVFDEFNIARLAGNWGIANNRYSTVGSAHNVENVQPFTVHSPFGISMVHNGNLTNYQSLKEELATTYRHHCNSNSDSEALLGVLAVRLHELGPSNGDLFHKLCHAVQTVFKTVRGGYAVIGIIAGKGMFAFRDPHGIRPLTWGARESSDGSTDYIFASENTMYYPLGFAFHGDVPAGGLVFIDTNGQRFEAQLAHEPLTPCIFEYVYLARPDSVINNISVYKSRLRMGQNLARKWLRVHPDVKPDIVVPVPFSSNTAALSMAHEIGVRYSEGLYKNPFVGRTFIMPGQEKRRKSILQKLSPQEIELSGKEVLLVDDSIVRGNTSKEVVRLVRNAGAKKVYFASAAPPIKYPDVYGIDIPTRSELIASRMSVEEIRNFIEADILMYQDIEDVVEAVARKGDHGIERFSMPCFDGWYVTQDVNEEKMLQLERTRGAHRNI